MKPRHQIGDRFDQLEIVALTKDNSGRSVYRCRCSCGGSVLIRGTLLTQNKTNNYGCRPRGKWKGVGKLSKTMFYRIQKNATKRGIDFSITIEEASAAFDQQHGRCALSGLEISFGSRTADRSTASLDRIDSSRGYVAGNIQWVHKDVNRMKMDLPENRLLELCRLICERRRDLQYATPNETTPTLAEEDRGRVQQGGGVPTEPCCP